MPSKEPPPEHNVVQIGIENLNRNIGMATSSPRYVELARVSSDASQSPVERARAAFPDFSFDHVLPAGFADASLPTDETPNFRNRHLNLCITLDLEDPEIRKTGPKSKRYKIFHMDGRGELIGNIAPLSESDDWQIFAYGMNDAILKAHGWRIVNTDPMGDDDHTAWARSLAGGKRAYITGPKGDHHIGADDHVLAAIFWPEGECIYTHSETASDAVTWVSDNAETAPETLVSDSDEKTP